MLSHRIGGALVVALVSFSSACRDRPALQTLSGADSGIGTASDPAARPAPLPFAPGAQVLAVRQEPLPEGTPDWARALAELVDRDDVRYLQATGSAARIRNPALATSTAEARARAELARWAQTERLSGSEVIDRYWDPQSGTSFARVAMPVPKDWIPGQPLEPAAGELGTDALP